MNLVKNNPLEVSDDVTAVVQHGPENLGRHDEAGRLGIDLNVASDEADIAERVLEVSKLLVGQGLDGRRVDGARHVLLRQRDRVLGHDGLAGGRVRRHEHRLVPF